MSEDEKLDRLLSLYNKYSDLMCFRAERPVYLLLSGFKYKLPELDSYFHKAFRQIDVIDNGEGAVDMAIWELLQKAPIFWTLYDYVNGNISKPELVSELVKIDEAAFGLDEV